MWQRGARTRPSLSLMLGREDCGTEPTPQGFAALGGDEALNILQADAASLATLFDNPKRWKLLGRLALD